jgi:hypothetical protein
LGYSLALLPAAFASSPPLLWTVTVYERHRDAVGSQKIQWGIARTIWADQTVVVIDSMYFFGGNHAMNQSPVGEVREQVT